MKVEGENELLITPEWLLKNGNVVGQTQRLLLRWLDIQTARKRKLNTNTKKCTRYSTT
ncbi:hypothetical protein YC2023_079093 [Brassica napus]